MEEHSGRLLKSKWKRLLKNSISNNTKFDKGFLKRSVKLWNHLPEEMKGIVNIHLFKARVVSELKQGKINFPDIDIPVFHRAGIRKTSWH